LENDRTVGILVRAGLKAFPLEKEKDLLFRSLAVAGLS